MKKYIQITLLTLVPAGILTYGLLFYDSLNKLFITWTDPSYAYLFNGLNLASGNLIIGHIDHPGTPVQCFVAFVIRMVYLFRGNTPLMEDVLGNPELYIAIICRSILFIICLLTFFVGYTIYKKSGKLWKGLFFQLTAVLSFETIHHATVLMTEPFLIMAMLLLVLLSYLYNRKEVPPNADKKYSILFAAISGFAMAVKISAAPILFIPLLMLRGIKNKMIFIGTTVLSFFLFILPAIKEFRNFKNFILGIFKHTGKYGTGPDGFIVMNEFKSNLYLIFTKEYLFPFSIILLITALLYGLFTNPSLCIKEKRFRLLTGIFVATTLQILIVAKHYSSHYLIPVHCLLSLSLYFSFSQLIPWKKPEIFYSKDGLKAFAVLILACFLFFRTSLHTNFNEFRINPHYTTNEFLLFYPNTPRIIASTEFTTPFPEPALYFGWVFSGKMKNTYSNTLEKLHPHSYFYSVPGNLYYGWKAGEEFILTDLLAKNAKMLLYIRQTDNVCEKIIFDAIKDINLNATIVSTKEVFRNKDNQDVIYEINSDTSKMASLLKLQNLIVCDMESRTADYTMFTSNTKALFTGGLCITDEKAYDGKHGVLLNYEDQYALQTTFKANAGNTYEISIWKQSCCNDLNLVVTSSKGEFYKMSTFPCRKEGPWEELKLKFILPHDFKIDSLKAYVWNTKDTKTILDNMKIKEFSFK